MTSDDLGIDIGFRTEVINSVERQNLFNSMSASRARRAGIEPPRPVLAILQEFFDEKIGRAIKEGNSLRAIDALGDLRLVLVDLVRVGRTEFKADLARIDFEMARIIQTCRQKLVEAFLDPATSPEAAQSISEALVEIIECGAWPNWQFEFRATVEHVQTLKAG
jgi:hypothetical protein